VAATAASSTGDLEGMANNRMTVHNQKAVGFKRAHAACPGGASNPCNGLGTCSDGPSAVVAVVVCCRYLLVC